MALSFSEKEGLAEKRFKLALPHLAKRQISKAKRSLQKQLAESPCQIGRWHCWEKRKALLTNSFAKQIYPRGTQ